jgi:arsenate reductase
MRIVRPTEWTRQPWRNGGGITHEILREGPTNGPFLLRVSVAEVERDGPFSRFDGVDRVIALLDGAGFVLHRADGTDTVVRDPGLPVAFPGEEPIECSLVRGPVRDLNVMVDRARARVRCERVHLDPGLHELACEGDRQLVFVLEGAPRVEGQALPRHTLVVVDTTLHLDAPTATTLLVGAHFPYVSALHETEEDPMAKKDASVRVFQYAGCGTCKKALRWLDARGVAYEAIPIVERPPSLAELKRLVKASGLPARRWINTSGGSYRALVAERGKEAVEALSEDALLALLAADGKMIKRPVVVAGERVLVGFAEAAYEELFPGAGRNA